MIVLQRYIVDQRYLKAVKDFFQAFFQYVVGNQGRDEGSMKDSVFLCGS